ncbi:MAG: hypothetical protein IT437_01270 [Phycisphaerales bacterium]|nr:hypothetical protein [Phycisphaerales bacterium]
MGRPALCLVALLAPAAAAQELYRQAPQPGTSGLDSQEARNPGGPGWYAEAADNFTAAGPWSIGHVEFWGFYASHDPAPEATDAFIIRVYSAAAGTPGTRLFERESTVFTQEEAFHIGFTTNYKCSVTLSPPCTLPGAGDYYLSIVAVRDSGGPNPLAQWRWLKCPNPLQPLARQWVFSPGMWQGVDQDTSFVLSSGAPACRPDCNGDGALNLADLGCFQTRFALGDPYADCNGDGARNLSDFGCFLTGFALGCP